MAEAVPGTVVGVPVVATQSGIPFWRAPWRFAVHGVVGTSIFAIIAGLAVAIDLSVARLQILRVSTLVIVGLTGAEYAVFATDLFLFCVFLFRTARRTMKDL